MLKFLLMLIAACRYRCLYWLPPVPHAGGNMQSTTVAARPEQLEYG
jgi:hypothetical protein